MGAVILNTADPASTAATTAESKSATTAAAPAATTAESTAATTAAGTATTTPLWRPPAPRPLGPLRSLFRVLLKGERNLLSLLPAPAYRLRIGLLGWSRRGIVLVNEPALVSEVLLDPQQIYPKNDLMVDALQALVGDSMFVCSGPVWQRQRAMIAPAFALMRMETVFDGMCLAVEEQVAALAQASAAGTSLSLDAMLSRLTADIVCRALFSVPLTSQAARAVFEDFLIFERSCASVNVGQLIFGRPWAAAPQSPAVREACARIRAQIGVLLDDREARGGGATDIAGMLLVARDPDTGGAFTREELIDQLGVFFLAGHETTASALTWAFFILSMQPALADRVRHEVAGQRARGVLDVAALRQLPFTRNVFRETLRLYPPITFLPRVALRDGMLGSCRIRRGNMIMIAPWILHRHAGFWQHPEHFDPDRFDRGLDRGQGAGTYIPFGQGPRVCVGAAFANLEATLILARLLECFDFVVEHPEQVRPAARLTTRPEREIHVRVIKRTPDPATGQAHT